VLFMLLKNDVWRKESQRFPGRICFAHRSSDFCC